MSMLGRYKKKGGFLQLLAVIEQSGLAKQEKFLKIIEEEDPRWAEALKSKMLTVKKIFSWDDQALAEIVGPMGDLALSITFHGLNDNKIEEKVFKLLSGTRKKNIEIFMKEKQPTPAEISSIYLQILTDVRGLIATGYVHLERIDPNLMIDDMIEETLSQTGSFKSFKEVDDKSSSPKEAPSKDVAKYIAEIEMLKKRYNQVVAENKALLERLKQVENKLDVIRKNSAA